MGLPRYLTTARIVWLPEFIVLYNGKKEFPDFMEMKLSDLFELKTELCSLELVVKLKMVLRLAGKKALGLVWKKCLPF